MPAPFVGRVFHFRMFPAREAKRQQSILTISGRVMATNVTSISPTEVRTETKLGKVSGNRWIQLVCGIIALIVFSNYQYAFTLFTP